MFQALDKFQGAGKTPRFETPGKRGELGQQSDLFRALFGPKPLKATQNPASSLVVTVEPEGCTGLLPGRKSAEARGGISHFSHSWARRPDRPAPGAATWLPAATGTGRRGLCAGTRSGNPKIARIEGVKDGSDFFCWQALGKRPRRARLRLQPEEQLATGC